MLLPTKWVLSNAHSLSVTGLCRVSPRHLSAHFHTCPGHHGSLALKLYLCVCSSGPSLEFSTCRPRCLLDVSSWMSGWRRCPHAPQDKGKSPSPCELLLLWPSLPCFLIGGVIHMVATWLKPGRTSSSSLTHPPHLIIHQVWPVPAPCVVICPGHPTLSIFTADCSHSTRLGLLNSPPSDVTPPIRGALPK